MNDQRRATLGWLVCAAFAVGTTACLHFATTRADAGYIAVLGPLWGLVAAGCARGNPQRSTVIATAIFFRVLFIGTPLLLSDDAWRFLWEGKLLNAGGNPFATAPQDVKWLDEPLRALVNHPEISSIYPPVALAWFRVLAWGGSSAPVAQAGAAIADVATAIGLWSVLKGRGRPTWPALVYALHPLAVLESAAGAHLEALALGLATWGVYLHDRKIPFWSAFITTLAAGTKLLPGLSLPALLRTRAGWAGAAAGAVVLLMLAWPVLSAGSDLFRGFSAYNGNWSFNGAVFPWLEPWLVPHTRTGLQALGALIVAGAMLTNCDPVRLWAIVGLTFVLLTPTAHPWYFLWALVPALLLEQRVAAVAAGMMLASYAVLFSYNAASGAWTEAPWLWWVSWGAAFSVSTLYTVTFGRSEASAEPAKTAL